MSPAVENQTNWNSKFCEEILHYNHPQHLHGEDKLVGLEDGKEVVQQDIVTVDKEKESNGLLQGQQVSLVVFYFV